MEKSKTLILNTLKIFISGLKFSHTRLRYTDKFHLISRNRLFQFYADSSRERRVEISFYSFTGQYNLVAKTRQGQ